MTARAILTAACWTALTTTGGAAAVYVLTHQAGLAMAVGAVIGVANLAKAAFLLIYTAPYREKL